MADQSQGGNQTGGFRNAVGRGVKYVVTLFYKTPEDALPTVCKLPDCNKPPYIENDGRVHDFCCNSHAQKYRSMEEAAQRQAMMQTKPRLLTGQHMLGTPADCCTPGFMGTPATCSGQQSYGVPEHVVSCAGDGGSGSYATVAGHRVFGNGRGSNQGYAHHSGATYGFNEANFGSNEIRFYNRDEPYYEFTNFFPAPIILDGKQWPTTEHYFQAQKFIGTPFTEVIRSFQRPREAFDYSRNHAVSRWRRKDWENVKINIMHKALLAKFTQHADLREMLLSTGVKFLIEHSPYDSFWGNGGDDSGQNHLGLLLMEVRSEFKKAKEMATADTLESTLSHHTQNVYRETAQGSSAGGVSSQGGSPASSTCLVDLSIPKDNQNQRNDQKFKPDNVQQTPDKNSDNFASSKLHRRPESLPHIGDGQVPQPAWATTDSTTETDTAKTTTDADMEITETPTDIATKTAQNFATDTAADMMGNPTDPATNIAAMGITTTNNIMGTATDTTMMGNTATMGSTMDAATISNRKDTTTMGNTTDTDTTGNPTDTATMGHPTDTATMGHPTDTATKGNPTDTDTTGNPTDTATMGSPTDTATMGSPTDTATMGNPTDTATMGNPTDTATMGNPTDTATMGNPTDTATMGNPTDTATMGNPTDTATMVNPTGTATGTTSVNTASHGAEETATDDTVQPGTVEDSSTDTGSERAPSVVVKHEVVDITANDVSEPDLTEQPTQTVDTSFQDKPTEFIHATNDTKVENGQASLRQPSADTVESQSDGAGVDEEDMDTSVVNEPEQTPPIYPQSDISINNVTNTASNMNEMAAGDVEPMDI